jgi:hypothetical protein
VAKSVGEEKERNGGVAIDSVAGGKRNDVAFYSMVALW